MNENESTTSDSTSKVKDQDVPERRALLRQAAKATLGLAVVATGLISVNAAVATRAAAQPRGCCDNRPKPCPSNACGVN